MNTTLPIVVLKIALALWIPIRIPGAPDNWNPVIYWKSPTQTRTGYWYHFRKLTGARAATLPLHTKYEFRDEP